MAKTDTNFDTPFLSSSVLDSDPKNDRVKWTADTTSDPDSGKAYGPSEAVKFLRQLSDMDHQREQEEAARKRIELEKIRVALAIQNAEHREAERQRKEFDRADKALRDSAKTRDKKSGKGQVSIDWPTVDQMAKDFGWGDKTDEQVMDDYNQWRNKIVTDYVGDNISRSRATPEKNIDARYMSDIEKYLRSREKVGGSDGKKPLYDEVGRLRSRTLGEYAQDAGVTTAKALVGLGQLAVGALDLGTAPIQASANAGEWLGKKLKGEDPGEYHVTGGFGRVLERDLGIDLKGAQEYWSEKGSAVARAEDKQFDQAEGFTDTVGAMTVGKAFRMAGESLPQLFVGGAVTKVGKAAVEAIPWLAKYATPIAAGIGEGSVTAAANIEGIRSETASGSLTPGQFGAGVASGVLTGAIGGAMSRVFPNLDPDIIVARLRTPAGQRKVARWLLEVSGGALKEGVLEELPQSAQEQIWQNLALGKPWNEGLNQAMVGGAAAGMATGATMNAWRASTKGSGSGTTTPPPTNGPAPTPPGGTPIPPGAPPPLDLPDASGRPADDFDDDLDGAPVDFGPPAETGEEEVDDDIRTFGDFVAVLQEEGMAPATARELVREAAAEATANDEDTIVYSYNGKIQFQPKSVFDNDPILNNEAVILNLIPPGIKEIEISEGKETEEGVIEDEEAFKRNNPDAIPIGEGTDVPNPFASPTAEGTTEAPPAEVDAPPVESEAPPVEGVRTNAAGEEIGDDGYPITWTEEEKEAERKLAAEYQRQFAEDEAKRKEERKRDKSSKEIEDAETKATEAEQKAGKTATEKAAKAAAEKKAADEAANAKAAEKNTTEAAKKSKPVEGVDEWTDKAGNKHQVTWSTTPDEKGGGAVEVAHTVNGEPKGRYKTSNSSFDGALNDMQKEIERLSRKHNPKAAPSAPKTGNKTGKTELSAAEAYAESYYGDQEDKVRRTEGAIPPEPPPIGSTTPPSSKTERTPPTYTRKPIKELAEASLARLQKWETAKGRISPRMYVDSTGKRHWFKVSDVGGKSTVEHYIDTKVVKADTMRGVSASSVDKRINLFLQGIEREIIQREALLASRSTPASSRSTPASSPAKKSPPPSDEGSAAATVETPKNPPPVAPAAAAPTPASAPAPAAKPVKQKKLSTAQKEEAADWDQTQKNSQAWSTATDYAEMWGLGEYGGILDNGYFSYTDEGFRAAIPRLLPIALDEQGVPADAQGEMIAEILQLGDARANTGSGTSKAVSALRVEQDGPRAPKVLTYNFKNGRSVTISSHDYWPDGTSQAARIAAADDAPSIYLGGRRAPGDAAIFHYTMQRFGKQADGSVVDDARSNIHKWKKAGRPQTSEVKDEQDLPTAAPKETIVPPPQQEKSETKKKKTDSAPKEDAATKTKGARQLLAGATPVTEPGLVPYLQRKGLVSLSFPINAVHIPVEGDFTEGAEWWADHNASPTRIHVPFGKFMNGVFEIFGLQTMFIDNQGKSQKFNFGPVGGTIMPAMRDIQKVMEGDPIALTEGWATGVTINRALGVPTYALNGSNPARAIEMLREQFPKSRLIYYPETGEAGQNAAAKAKKAGADIGPAPPMEGDNQDWNDFFVAEGNTIASVRTALYGTLTPKELGEKIQEEAENVAPVENTEKVELPPAPITPATDDELIGTILQLARRTTKLTNAAVEVFESAIADVIPLIPKDLPGIQGVSDRVAAYSFLAEQLSNGLTFDQFMKQLAPFRTDKTKVQRGPSKKQVEAENAKKIEAGKAEIERANRKRRLEEYIEAFEKSLAKVTADQAAALDFEGPEEAKKFDVDIKDLSYRRDKYRKELAALEAEEAPAPAVEEKPVEKKKRAPAKKDTRETVVIDEAAYTEMRLELDDLASMDPIQRTDQQNARLAFLVGKIAEIEGPMGLATEEIQLAEQDTYVRDQALRDARQKALLFRLAVQIARNSGYELTAAQVREDVNNLLADNLGDPTLAIAELRRDEFKQKYGKSGVKLKLSAKGPVDLTSVESVLSGLSGFHVGGLFSGFILENGVTDGTIRHELFHDAWVRASDEVKARVREMAAQLVPLLQNAKPVSREGLLWKRIQESMQLRDQTQDDLADEVAAYVLEEYGAKPASFVGKTLLAIKNLLGRILEAFGTQNPWLAELSAAELAKISARVLNDSLPPGRPSLVKATPENLRRKLEKYLGKDLADRMLASGRIQVFDTAAEAAGMVYALRDSADTVNPFADMPEPNLAELRAIGDDLAAGKAGEGKQVGTKTLSRKPKKAPKSKRAPYNDLRDGNPILAASNINSERPSFAETAEKLGGMPAYMDARANGDTELDYKQWVHVRTPEFLSYFGDWINDPKGASKVLNPRTGEPLVIYHGSNSIEFDGVFRSEFMGHGAGGNEIHNSELATFFAADNDETANGYRLASPAANIQAIKDATYAEELATFSLASEIAGTHIRADLSTLADSSRGDVQKAAAALLHDTKYSQNLWLRAPGTFTTNYVKVFGKDNPRVTVPIENAIARTKDAHEEVKRVRELYKGPLLPMFLNIRNPYEADMRGKSYTGQAYDRFVKEAFKGGHDGIIISNVRDGGPVGTVYIFHDSSQAKHAKRNSGAYGKRVQNIYGSVTPRPQGAYGPPTDRVRIAQGDMPTPEQAMEAMTDKYGHPGASQMSELDAMMNPWRKLGAALNKTFVDHFAPIVRHLRRFGDQKLAQKAIDQLYAAKAVSSQLINRMRNAGGDEAIKAAAALAKTHNMSEAQVLKTIGTWMLAEHAAEANRVVRLELDKRLTKLIGDAAANGQPKDEVDGLKKLRRRKLKEFDAALNDPDTTVGKHTVALAGAMNLAQAQEIKDLTAAEFSQEEILSVAAPIWAMNTERLLVEAEHGRVSSGRLAELLDLTEPQRKLVVALARQAKSLRHRNDFDTHGLINAPEVWKKAQMDAAEDSIKMLNDLESLRDQVRAALFSHYVPFLGTAVDDSTGRQDFAPVDEMKVNDLYVSSASKTSLPINGIAASFNGATVSASAASQKDFRAAMIDYASSMTEEEQIQAGITFSYEKEYTKKDALYAGEKAGKHSWIVVPPQMLQILRGRDLTVPHPLMQKTFGTVTRGIGLLVTQAYLAFAPINQARDVQERLTFLSTQNITDELGNKISSKQLIADAAVFLARNQPDLIKAGAKLVWNNEYADTEAGRLLQLMSELGGLSMFRNQFDIAFEGIEKEVKKQNSKLHRGADSVMKLISAYNTGFEISAPLAAFQALRQQGINDRRAAAIVLDAMNFYKQGTLTAGISLFYPFSRAAFVGAQTMIRSWVDPKTGRMNARGMIITGAMSILMATIWAMAAGIDDDDDGSIPDVLALNDASMAGGVPIPVGGKYVMAPVGYGVGRIANVLGRELVKYGYGISDPEDLVIGALTTGWAPQMTPLNQSPVSFKDNFMLATVETFAPSWLTTGYLVSTNKNVFGGDAKPPHANPNYVSDRRIAPEYNDAARWFRANWGWKITGEGLQMMLNTVAPGMVSEALDGSVSYPHKTKTGTAANIPIVGRIVKEQNPGVWNNKAYTVYDRTKKIIDSGGTPPAADKWLMEQYNRRVSPLNTRTSNSAIGSLPKERQYKIYAEVAAQKAKITRQLFAEYIRRKQSD
jgi:hypothetical protein